MDTARRLGSRCDRCGGGGRRDPDADTAAVQHRGAAPCQLSRWSRSRRRRRRTSRRGSLVDALAPTDAQIAAGSVTAVVGVSGSGKSTLLRLVAGHEAPSSGRVTVSGRDLATFSGRRRDRFRRETVTYVSQRAADNLFPQLNLAEHLPGSVAAAVRGPRHRLAHVGRPGELSGGELARACVCRRVARGAPLVVVDEPTAELDRTTAGDVLAAMDDAASRGQTFVVATHDPTVIELAGNVLDLTRRRPGGAHAHVRGGTPRRGVALRLREVTKTYSGDRRDRRRLARRAGRGARADLRTVGLRQVDAPDGRGRVDRPRSRPGRAGADRLARARVRPAAIRPRPRADRAGERRAARAARRRRAGGRQLRTARHSRSSRSAVPAQISIGQQQRVAIARALRPVSDRPRRRADVASGRRPPSSSGRPSAQRPTRDGLPRCDPRTGCRQSSRSLVAARGRAAPSHVLGAGPGRMAELDALEEALREAFSPRSRRGRRRASSRAASGRASAAAPSGPSSRCRGRAEGRRRSAGSGRRRGPVASEPCCFSTSAAFFGPTPGAPGILSDGSPRSAMKSGTCLGSTP